MPSRYKSVRKLRKNVWEALLIDGGSEIVTRRRAADILTEIYADSVECIRLQEEEKERNRNG